MCQRQLRKRREAVVNARSAHDSETILENGTCFVYLQCEMDDTFVSDGEECFFVDIAIGPKLPDHVKALFSAD